MDDFTRNGLPATTQVSNSPSFDRVLQARLNRRTLLKGTFGFAATAFFGNGIVACGEGTAAAAATASPTVESKTLKLNFNAIAKSLADVVSVPAGYTATVLYHLGDPIAAGVA